MQQKIVIKVQLKCKKCRSTAMSIAAREPGVNTVRLEGEEKDYVVVIGDRVDAAGLTRQLRRKVGRASLESVDEFEDA